MRSCLAGGSWPFVSMATSAVGDLAEGGDDGSGLVGDMTAAAGPLGGGEAAADMTAAWLFLGAPP